MRMGRLHLMIVAVLLAGSYSSVLLAQDSATPAETFVIPSESLSGVAATTSASTASTDSAVVGATGTSTESMIDPTATVEVRLAGLQKALEKAAEANWTKMPESMDALVKYLPNGEKDLINPETGGKFLMNKKMGGRFERTIVNAGRFITFYADQETPNMGRAVIYANGKTAYLSAEEFKKQLDASTCRAIDRDEMEAMRDEYESAMREKRYQKMLEQQKADQAPK